MEKTERSVFNGIFKAAFRYGLYIEARRKLADIRTGNEDKPA